MRCLMRRLPSFKLKWNRWTMTMMIKLVLLKSLKPIKFVNSTIKLDSWLNQQTKIGQSFKTIWLKWEKITRKTLMT
jgi:hypothetical protein